MGQIKTIDKGTGKPVVVLIHGICCAPEDYQWHIDAMSKSHRGAKAIINANGEIVDGWIGGGCAKTAVVNAAVESINDGEP